MDPLKKAVAKGKSERCQTGSLSCSGKNDHLSPCPPSPRALFMRSLQSDAWGTGERREGQRSGDDWRLTSPLLLMIITSFCYLTA